MQNKKPHKRRREHMPPAELIELGYPADLPELPLPVENLLKPPVPDDFMPTVIYARETALERWLLGNNGVWGAGITKTEKGGPSLLLLVDHKHRRGIPKLPRSINVEGEKVPLVTKECPHSLNQVQGGPFIRATGASSGSSISNNTMFNALGDGGTYSGTCRSLTGGGIRGYTCAHVALGWGFVAFLNNLPGSVTWLFTSPRGERMLVAGGPNIGQNPYELFRVDTPWPVLTWLPFAIPGPVLTFLYIDVAAGRIRPRAITNPPVFFPPPAPPGLPPVGRLVSGARFGSPRYFPFGERVFAIGAELGLRWGRAIAAGLTVVLPIPVPGIPILVVFNLNLYDMDIRPGDSGCVPTTVNGFHPTGLAGLGLGGTINNQTNFLTLATPVHLVQPFARIRM